MGYIARSFIDDLLARVNIVDLISQYCVLKKSGKNYKSCCPFHSEKTPSFNVSLEKQFFNCFGCGEGGNAIDFVSKYLKLDFVDSVVELANFAGVEVVYEGSAYQSKRQSGMARFYGANSSISKLYCSMLVSGDGTSVYNYALARGLTDDVLNLYGIGFAPERWQFVLNHNIGLSNDDLVRLSLVSVKNDRYFDFFRNRLMFPIRDLRGRTVGFGGRVITAEGAPKYLNSAETPIFNKRHVLYGLYEVLQKKMSFDRLIVVEGYMDVVSLASHGIENAVGTLGTSLSSQHMKLIFKYVSEVVFVFDGDKAGRAASERAVNESLPFVGDKNRVKILNMPDGLDPDDYVQQNGKNSFDELVSEQALDLSNYLFLLSSSGCDNSIEGRSRTAKKFCGYLGKMSESFFKESLVSKVSSYLQIDVSTVESTFENKKIAGTSEARNCSRALTPIRVACFALISYPEILKQVDVDISVYEQINSKGFLVLSELINIINSFEGELSTPILLEHLRVSNYYKTFCKILTLPVLINENNAYLIFKDSLSKELEQFLKSHYSNLREKSRVTGLSNSEKLTLSKLARRRSI